MAKMIVITNASGNVVGSVRADPVETDIGIIQAQIPGRAAPSPAYRQDDQRADFIYHEVDVPDELMGGSVENLHTALKQRISPEP
jgi:hypothetical protein